MKTIKNSKDLTTLEVGDVVVFGDLRYVVDKSYPNNSIQYYLYCSTGYNGIIFEKLNLKKRDFIEKLGINANCVCDFPEVKSLEALTAIVSALFKEYEKQSKQLTYEDVCKELFKNGYCYTNAYGETMADGHNQLFVTEPNTATTRHQLECILAKNMLANVARYLNGEWDNFLNENHYIIWMNPVGKCLHLKHSNFAPEHSTIIFKSEELALKAIKILGEETVKLALEPLY